MTTIQTLLHAAYLWLAAINPLLPWGLLVFVPCFVVPWAIRTWLPHVWETLPGLVDKLALDIGFNPDGGLARVLSKIVQALPSAVMGSVAAALAIGGDPATAAKGAAWACLAPLGHELLKAMPWLPYVGGAFPAASLGKPKVSKPPSGGAGAAVLLLCAGLAIGNTGCGVLHSAVPVIDVITQAIVNVDNIVDAIDTVAPTVLAEEHATDAQVAAYQHASAAFHLAVAGIQQTDAGAKALDSGDVEAALAKLAQAWKDYVAAAKAAGLDVHTLKPGAPGLFKATRGTVSVPEPIVMRGRS